MWALLLTLACIAGCVLARQLRRRVGDVSGVCRVDNCIGEFWLPSLPCFVCVCVSMFLWPCCVSHVRNSKFAASVVLLA